MKVRKREERSKHQDEQRAGGKLVVVPDTRTRALDAARVSGGWSLVFARLVPIRARAA